MKTFLIATFTLLATTLNAQQTYEYRAFPLEETDPTAIINATESYPEDADAHFNLAVLYYNQGILLIDNIYDDATDEQLKAIQQQVLALFERALAPALTAHKLNPKRAETCEMLSGIYFGLNDMENSELYTEKLRKLNGK